MKDRKARDIPAIGKQAAVKGWGLDNAPRIRSTFGFQHFDTFKGWSDWLREQSKTRQRS